MCNGPSNAEDVMGPFVVAGRVFSEELMGVLDLQRRQFGVQPAGRRRGVEQANFG